MFIRPLYKKSYKGHIQSDLEEKVNILGDSIGHGEKKVLILKLVSNSEYLPR
jgi:hypothetical protein